RTHVLGPSTSTRVTADLSVETAEMDAFLSVLYPLDFKDGDLKTRAEWTAVLKLATRWSFQSIRDLAINKLNFPLFFSPVDRLELARTYNVQEWVDVAIQAICARRQCLTLPEIRRMTVEDLALITTLRDK
ncbi:hypothetical protein K488DRAFT_35872, partial [Vararia minispora EC-137]